MDMFLGIRVVRDSAELTDLLAALPGCNWSFGNGTPFNPSDKPSLAKYCYTSKLVDMTDEHGLSLTRLVNSARPYVSNLVYTDIDGTLHFLIILEPKGGARKLTANCPTGEEGKVACSASIIAASETSDESGVLAMPQLSGKAYVWASAHENPDGGLFSAFATPVDNETTYQPPARNPNEPVTPLWIPFQVLQSMARHGDPVTAELDFYGALGLATLANPHFSELLCRELHRREEK